MTLFPALVLLALAPALAAPAAAPPSPAAVAPAAPDLSALRSEAEALIRAAHAEAHFTNDTRRGYPAARHNGSGMRCVFEIGDPGNAIVATGAAGGMACVSRPVGFLQTLEAVRLAPGDTLDSVFASSVSALTTDEPEARLHAPGGVVVRLAPGVGGRRAAEPRTAGYLVQRPGQQVYSRISVAVVGDWIIRQRFEAPAARADEAEMLAGVVMSTTLIDLAGRSG
jgi:hypothetical protein